MRSSAGRPTRPRSSRLTRLASHVTAATSRSPPDADARRSGRSSRSGCRGGTCTRRTTSRSKGGEKVTASVAQTRYAKWVLGAVTGQLGLVDARREPIFDKLLARAP